LWRKSSDTNFSTSSDNVGGSMGNRAVCDSTFKSATTLWPLDQIRVTSVLRVFHWFAYSNQDLALHGTYWHDKFGFKHSHGCVNLPPADANWIYNWTTPSPTGSNWTVVPDRKNNDIGTWVWVHEG
jgi:hypothetical protein